MNLYALAALIRPMVWAKHPPEYHEVYPGQEKPTQDTDAKMYAKVRALNKLFGGSEED